MVELLWTGGWDSTYRLVDLILVQQRPVQPYYLIDPGRRSTLVELSTRQAIRAELVRRQPEVSALLHPTVVYDTTDLPPDPVVEGWLAGLRTHGWLGKQYIWLAQFAALRGLTALELSLNRDDRPRARLAQDVTPTGTEAGVYRLADRLTDPNLEIFRRFQFPIFDFSKREMQQAAIREGFADLMEMTWFCHTPRGTRPCGTCAPCRDIVAEGLGRRLPLLARIRRRLML